VLGVCRRVLGNGPDADDAFQATFLVLANKAGSIRARRGVGGWLHGVAWRIARKARVAAARRRKHEQEAAALRPTVGEVEAACQTIGPVLDEELQRLPARYRLPLVLCYWEECTHEAAARELGIPTGTLSWRLGRARTLLRQRLVRRGPPCPGNDNRGNGTGIREWFGHHGSSDWFGAKRAQRDARGPTANRLGLSVDVGTPCHRRDFVDAPGGGPGTGWG
jgi:RNA polymerase sigma factor (sigma-70 family)